MTSFMFEGPAVGGPANGRLLISHTKTFVAIYPAQIDATMYSAAALIRSQRIYCKFRYRAQRYGNHQFFLPAHQSLNHFLKHWNPPKDQAYWSAFLQSAIAALQKTDH